LCYFMRLTLSKCHWVNNIVIEVKFGETLI
jgi:hypothetical protein